MFLGANIKICFDFNLILVLMIGAEFCILFSVQI
jgi:hypothetical protein